MNILEIEDMVKGLPDDRLQQEAEMPTGQVPQFLVVSEIQRRADMRKRFSERQQEQPQGTVKDQIVQEGIAAMAPPEPQMQAAMMGGPQPMPPQMPMAPQGPMPPQGMAEGGVVRMQEGMLTPYATALTNYQSLIEPLSQQLAMLQNQGGNVDKILDLEGQMRSIYENLGLDRYSLDEKRAALSDSSPEEIQSAYNRAGLNPDRYADIVGSIGTYAGEGEDNQDVNLPTATPRARDIPELTVVGERLKDDGPLFGPAYTPEVQLSGAVTTDAKRGLSTGTAFDPEVIRLATAPDTSGGLYSVLGQDLTAMSVQDESTVRGGDASVQGPTGRQRAVATSTDASGLGGIPLPLYLRVLTSALGSNTSIDDSRRTDLENLIASAETKDNQGPLFGPDFTPKFGPDFTPKFGPPVPPSLGEQGPDFGPPIPPDVRVDGPAFGPPIPPDVRVDGPVFGPNFTPTEDSQISRYRDAIKTAETTGTEEKGSASGKILAPIEGSTIEEIANNIYSYRQPVIQSRRGSKPDDRYESREELFLRVFGEDAPGDALDAARSAYNLKLQRAPSPRFTDYALSSNALDQYLVTADKKEAGETAVADGSVVATDGRGAGLVGGADAGVGGSINNELLQRLIRGGTAVDGGATVDQIDSDSADQVSFELDNNFITGGGSETYQTLISDVERRRKELAERVRNQQAPSLDYSGLISESQARLDQQLEAIKSEKGAQALIALGAGIARGDLGAGLSDAGKAVAASNAQKRALQARQQALEAGLKKSQVDAVFQQAIRQEENQIKAEGMMIDALEAAGARKRDAEKFAMNYGLQLRTLDNQLKRWTSLDEQSKQRTITAILSFAESSLKNVIGLKPEDLEKARDAAIRQAAIMYGLSPEELGLDSAETADTGGSEKRFGVTEVPDKGAT